MTSQILTLIIYPLFFGGGGGYFQNTIHGPSAVPKRFKRNINEELLKAMRTNSDIKAGIDRIFKMYLNANYRRTFTCLVIHAFDIKVGKIAYLRSI